MRLIHAANIKGNMESTFLLPYSCGIKTLISSKASFEAWLDGYRSVRPFNRHNEQAVAAFGIIGELRVVAWKLGVARSSRGKPLLGISDLPGIVDAWLD